MTAEKSLEQYIAASILSLGGGFLQLDAIRAVDLLEQIVRSGHRIFLIGNGGSASNASHIAQDLNRITSADETVRDPRAISLTDDVSTLTAMANDHGYASVFELQLMTHADPGDLLIALSTTGNSPNVIRAADYAVDHGVAVLACTGTNGGQLGNIAGYHLRAGPARSEMMVVGIVESLHLLIFHWIIDELARRLRGA